MISSKFPYFWIINSNQEKTDISTTNYLATINHTIWVASNTCSFDTWDQEHTSLHLCNYTPTSALHDRLYKRFYIPVPYIHLVVDEMFEELVLDVYHLLYQQPHNCHANDHSSYMPSICASKDSYTLYHCLGLVIPSHSD